MLKKLFLAAAVMLGVAIGAHADTTTARFRFILPSTGTPNWGLKLNDWMVKMDTGVPGLSGANTFLTNSSNTFLSPIAVSSISGNGSGLTVSTSAVIVGSATVQGGGGLGVSYGMTAGSGTFTGGITASSANITGPGGVSVTGASGLNTTYGVVAGSITVGGTVLTANVAGGNVGIGTANPNTKLHMSSGTLTIDGSGAGLTVNGATPIRPINFNGTGIGMQTNGVEKWVIDNPLSGFGLYNNTQANYAYFVTPQSAMGIQTTNPATTLDVNGSAQFGSGATKSTFTATGFYVPVSMTLAQIQAYTPSALENHGLITCSNCASPYSVCQATNTVINAFRLGTTGTAACQ